MMIACLSQSIWLRIASFLDEVSLGALSRTHRLFDEIVRRKLELEEMAEGLPHDYKILSQIGGDPLWLALGDDHVVILLGEFHHNLAHLELNSLVASYLMTRNTLFLTEATPPATQQLILPPSYQSQILRWENKQLFFITGKFLSPLIEWQQGLIERFHHLRQSKRFLSDLRQFASLVAECDSREVVQEFRRQVHKLQRDANRHHCLFVATIILTLVMIRLEKRQQNVLLVMNPPRERALVKKICITLKEGYRPIVVAGKFHINIISPNRTLGMLAQKGIRYISLDPKN